ncbi:hypothetical protein [cf. Phormidesmis sp. LEGE 11477]|uniref:hypothetical protein n=1 Tax=cf. Phormidesmis sp. LEGE 11477 TaxID=1828680 RepID=UPI00187E81E0|nr:hypothetical protein [cf. Phormidesmis sp. LEGE 11477]MBE9063694.1 hypothetical protein [cf. Phormidesmis sp. LEGE 11477]
MQTELVKTTDLSAADRSSMYALLESHFDGATSQIFETDLALKNWVLLLKDDSLALKGFSTMLMYDVAFADRLLTVVFSGDTIVDPSAWSSSLLSQAWVAAVNQLRTHYKGEKLYWLLISSGFRTYRFLPTFWRTFYPRHNRPTPPEMQRLMQFLSQRQFGEWYDAAAGVVKFPAPQRLKGHLEGIPTERLRNPHIRFFAQQNPGYDRGDELVCLTEIAAENLTKAGRRMWFQEVAIVNGVANREKVK